MFKMIDYRFMRHLLKKLVCAFIVAVLVLSNAAAAYAVQSCPHTDTFHNENSDSIMAGDAPCPDHQEAKQNAPAQDGEDFCGGDDCKTCLKCFTSPSVVPQFFFVFAQNTAPLHIIKTVNMISAFTDSAYHPPIFFS